MNDVETRVKTFLSRFFRQHDLQPDEDIFALGFVNSLLAMQLVNFVEKEFGVTIEDEDLDLDNFRSLRSIDALVARKRGGGAAEAGAGAAPAGEAAPAGADAAPATEPAEG